MSKTASSIKVISKNRKASHNYFLLEKFEAGISLKGSEIKSIRDNLVNLQQSYVREEKGELWLLEAHISPYAFSSYDNHEPTRPRKLLLHKREINKIAKEMQAKQLTVVPTMIYLKKGKAKVEIALARGKQQHDKRQDIAKKDAKRQMERNFRNSNRG